MKRFVLQNLAIYVVVGLTLMVLFGPPGLSKEYLADYKVDHDRYLEISKSDSYKQYQERPELFPPKADQVEAFRFVAAYEARPAFQKENRRRMTYTGAFDLFNFLMVSYLIVHFGGKPLVRFLDTQIEQVKNGIQRAAHSRETATRRKEDIQQRLDHLQEEKKTLLERTQGALHEEQELMEQQETDSLRLMEQETEDRKRAEIITAQRCLQTELVTQSIQALMDQYRNETSVERLAVYVGRFVEELERKT